MRATVYIYIFSTLKRMKPNTGVSFQRDGESNFIAKYMDRFQVFRLKLYF